MFYYPNKSPLMTETNLLIYLKIILVDVIPMKSSRIRKFNPYNKVTQLPEKL